MRFASLGSGSEGNALVVEAATNDLVVLPIVLVAIAALTTASAMGGGDWLRLLGELFVLGPVIGFLVGAAGAWAMTRVDRRWGIRREYQALYGMGLVFTAYAGGVAAGGDGFLAAFAAGAAIATLGLELCDCFVEYGEATSGAAFWESVVRGEAPMLAPGTLIQFGLLALLYAYRHPSLKRPDEA